MIKRKGKITLDVFDTNKVFGVLLTDLELITECNDAI